MLYTKHYATFFILRAKMKTNLYIQENELEDLINNLSPSEIRVYTYLYHSPNHNPTVEYFNDDVISQTLNLTIKTVQNCKSKLKTKGYALLSRFKDAKGLNRIDVVVGKEQVELYNLNLLMSTNNKKHHEKAITLFPKMMDRSVPLEERKEIAKKANKYVLEHPEEFIK